MAETVSSGPVPQLVAFGRELRARGLPVGTGRILTFVRAVAALGLTDRDLALLGRPGVAGGSPGRPRDLRPGVRRLVPLPGRHRANSRSNSRSPPSATSRRSTGGRSPTGSRSPSGPPPPNGTTSTPRTMRRSPTGRARSGSWRAAPRCCGRSRSASSPRTSARGCGPWCGRSRSACPENAPAGPGPRPKGAGSTSGGRCGGRCAPRGAVRPGLARPHHPQPPARAHPGHQRVDGAVLTGVDAVRVRRDGGGPARRDVRVRHAAHARHADAADEGSRPRARRDRRAGGGLGGRHAHRREPQDVAGRVEPARGAPRGRRRAVLRRSRARRPGAPAPRRWPACAASRTGWCGSTR